MTEQLVRNGFPLFLEQNERRLLSKMVADDVRTPVDQVRWLIVQEAHRRGLLPQAKAVQTTEVEMARLHSELEHAHKRIAELEGWIRNFTGGAEAKRGLLMHKIENPDNEP